MLSEKLAVRHREDSAAIERIEQDLLVGARGPDDEMPRQTDAGKRKPGALADRHRDRGQADRDAHAPFEDLVEIAISRVVVFTLVAAKSHFVEEIPAQSLNLVGEMPAQIRLDFARHRGQFIEVRFDVQKREFVPRQKQGDLREIQGHSRIAGKHVKS